MLKKQIENVLVTVEFKGLVETPFKSVSKTLVNKHKVKCKNVDTGVSISFPFYDSIHSTNTKSAEHDELMDSVLYCIRMDFSYDRESFPTFEDFARDFGYDQDSRKAEKTYKDLMRQSEKLKSVFTEEVIDTLPE